jgi:hypothetical protein
VVYKIHEQHTKQKEAAKLPAVDEEITPLRKSFENNIGGYVAESLKNLTGALGVPASGDFGFQSVKSWTEDNVFWCTLIYLRMPSAPPIDIETLEQARKLLDNSFINVITKGKKFSVSNDKWDARIFEISENNGAIAIDVLFIDCDKAAEIAQQLNAQSVSSEITAPIDSDFGGGNNG